MRHHEIKFQHPAPGNTPGNGSTLTIDGADITNTVEGLRIEHVAAHGNTLPRVTLVMPMANLAVDTDALVTVDDATHDLLRRLGWTPPARDDESVRFAVYHVLCEAVRQQEGDHVTIAGDEHARLSDLAETIVAAVRDAAAER
jgi:hypothetical protein